MNDHEEHLHEHRAFVGFLGLIDSTVYPVGFDSSTLREQGSEAHGAQGGCNPLVSA